ncbi:MAG TPA: hypothetical protein VKB12_20430 [Pyrinomonadaceae bacterium]|nr:hypothetical protein [Pyrinomonadaceae bacterium]
MRIVRFTFMSALLLSGLAAASLTTRAESASGTYKFTVDDKSAKYVEFDAQRAADGSVSGSLFFSDEATIVYQDVDEAGDPREKFAGAYIKADIDGLVVEENQAVMSGTVRDSSIPYLVGLRVLLTVEDNGDNTRVPDKLTWGVYKFIKRDWKPSDAEWENDPGVGLTWWATDLERRDDKGYQMPRPDEPAGTQSFPVASYAFVDTSDGSGDIRVAP